MVTDAAPYRRNSRKAPAILLAVVLLAVLGSSVGYIAGKQRRVALDAQRANQGGGTLPGPASDPQSQPSPAGGGCPAQSEKDAGRALTQVLHLRTAGSPGSEVWICADSAGGLWYQGLLLDGLGFTNDNSILLRSVRDNGDGSYAATNAAAEGTTKYRVSKDGLTVERPDGTRRTEPASGG
jgi:hypothetical protein